MTTNVKIPQPVVQAINALLLSSNMSLKDLTEKKSESPGQLLNVRQAAKRLSCSVPTIYRLIKRGELDAIKISEGCTRISEAQIIKIGGAK